MPFVSPECVGRVAKDPLVSRSHAVLAVEPLPCMLALYPWHRPEDIRRYPWCMTRDIATVISWVIYHRYLRISRVNSLKTQ